MSIKIGISGFGRIAKIAIMAAEQWGEPYEIVGINWRSRDLDYMLYMLRYDTVFGRFDAQLDKYEDGIIINGKKIPVYAETEFNAIPWKECGAEYVIDCTGACLTEEKALQHIEAGAKKVIMSAPAKDKGIPTFVYGVNEKTYKPEMNIVSAASCTTNCLAPLCKVIQDNFGIESGLMTTIHAATSKQAPVDTKSPKDWRVGRSVFGNIIPTTTGAAKAVGLVIPEVKGKLTGMAFRIPAADVSVVDVDLRLSKPTTLEEINAKMKEAAEGELSEVILYTEDAVVSTDFVGCSQPCAFDAKMGIQLDDKFFKLIAYYDNEWGYTCNMLRLVRYMGEHE